MIISKENLNLNQEMLKKGIYYKEHFHDVYQP